MSTLGKARLYVKKSKDNILFVQFNPNTLRYSVNSMAAHLKDGTDSAPKQGDPTGASGKAELSMTLYFYSFRSETDYDDVRHNINKLRPYLGRKDENGCIMVEKIGFAWGTMTLEGYLKSLDVSYQMFASDGTPVQAEVQMTIVGEDPDVKAENANHAKSVTIERAEAEMRDSGKKNSDPAESDKKIAWMYGKV